VSGFRLVESLSHRQREITPYRFAEYLVTRVRVRYGVYVVAALWVRADSLYFQIPGVECFDLSRDAYSYDGPHPVIAHPPCGPWGRYRAVSAQDAFAGIWAMHLVDRFGGVVEQPASSRLFLGGERVDQGEFGHLAVKATRLYWSNRA
jgi:hypothetical protein